MKIFPTMGSDIVWSQALVPIGCCSMWVRWMGHGGLLVVIIIHLPWWHHPSGLYFYHGYHLWPMASGGCRDDLGIGFEFEISGLEDILCQQQLLWVCCIGAFISNILIVFIFGVMSVDGIHWLIFDSILFPVWEIWLHISFNNYDELDLQDLIRGLFFMSLWHFYVFNVYVCVCTFVYVCIYICFPLEMNCISYQRKNTCFISKI